MVKNPELIKKVIVACLKDGISEEDIVSIFYTYDEKEFARIFLDGYKASESIKKPKPAFKVIG